MSGIASIALLQRAPSLSSVRTVTMCVPLAIRAIVPTVVKLDIDGVISRDFSARLSWVFSALGYGVEAVRYDKTRRGWHVLIFVRRKLAPRTVVALQAILGSDYRRETFNLLRVLSLAKRPMFWRERWNVLYNTHERGIADNGK
jgi:hypothetical protein